MWSTLSVVGTMMVDCQPTGSKVVHIYPHHSNRDANTQLNNSGALKEEEVPLLSSGKENRTSYWSDYGTLSNKVFL